MLYNVTEDFVNDVIDNIMKQNNCCTCDKCRSDVMAISLNHLKAHYVSTKPGKVLSKTKVLESQAQADVLSAVSLAAEAVKANPRH